MSTNSQPPTEPASASESPAQTEPGSAVAQRTDLETAVPEGAPVYRCAYCDRPFAEESYRTLHHGLAHEGVLDEAEREAFEAAYAEENASIGRFRIIALGLLVLLYFGFLFVFAVVT
jgi:hypothetical protein